MDPAHVYANRRTCGIAAMTTRHLRGGWWSRWHEGHAAGMARGLRKMKRRANRHARRVLDRAAVTEASE